MSAFEVNNTRIEQLKQQIVRGRAIVVAGAGVAAATTDHSPASNWLALVESGLAYALANVSGLPGAFEQYVQSDLDNVHAIPTALLSAAQKVEQALGGTTGSDFQTWLRANVGDIAVTNTNLVSAIAGLQCPIATFNFDTLIEKVTGLTPRTWKEATAVQAALHGHTRDVVHLHGAWTDPSSVIFGPLSYGRILSDVAAQAIQAAIGSMFSLIFIGCGDGLSDPNISELRKWLKQTFPESAVKHYRLCLASEAQALAAEHAGENIEIVEYGNSYAELPQFLANLRSGSEVIEADYVRRLTDELADRARNDSVLAKHMPDVQTRPITKILVPPVILPVTHEQYSESLRNENGPKLERSDVDADLESHTCIVLVADESTGLTSALQWMVARTAEVHGLVHPVVVDYKNFQGLHPLSRAVRLALRASEVPIADSAPFPDCALAIDNIMPSARPAFARTLAELPFAAATVTIFGCRTGAEAGLLEALRAQGLDPITRYVGRLNQNDIFTLAALVQPESARRITEKAVEILQRERLSRTPLTVCLLISVLLQGEALLSTASETALLDAYVSLLLGQGDPRDDSRFDFDAQDRISLLAALAEQFVNLDNGAIDESEAIKAFEQFFKEVRWKESASAVLLNLTRRHILISKNQTIRFAQSSFLHLFAARRAILKPDFRDRLLQRPHYYSQIIRHYAALSRSDEKLLHRMNALLAAETDDVQHLGRGRNLSRLKADELPSSMTIDRMLDAVDLTSADSTSEAEDPNRIDPLDEAADDDLVPFPATQIEEAPPLVRIISSLSLVSVVLRDSEQVINHELKRDLLANTLRFWGYLVDALEADTGFIEYMEIVGRNLVSNLELPEDEAMKFKKNFVELAPVLICFGAIRGFLTSRKLFLSLADCFEMETFLGDSGAAVMGALLGWDMAEEGWAHNLLYLNERHADVRAVTTVVRSIALYAYYHTRPSAEDEHDLLAFLAEQFSRYRESSHETAIEVKNHKGKVIQRLKSNRLKSLAKANKADRLD